MKNASTRVLYIDDDEGICRLVQRELERHGCKVELARSGEEGLSRLASGGIEAVGLDQNMPGLDGLGTLAKIGEIPDPPPVIFVTAEQDSRVAVAALKAGAFDYVIKDVQGEFLPLLAAAFQTALDNARMRRAKEAAEAEVRKARDRFEALAAERALLMREVNHRVGNSLQLIASMLKLQANNAASDDVRTAMTTATARVLAVAQVHKRLYTSDDVQSVALDQYLTGLVEDLRRSSTEGAMAQLTLSADSVAVHPDRAVAIGVAVSELVLNAVKYAYPQGKGPIRVTLKAGAPRIELSVEDDGVGRAGAGAAAPESTGLGQRIVTAMAQKLDAELHIDPAHKGTRVVLTFEPNPAAAA